MRAMGNRALYCCSHLLVVRYWYSHSYSTPQILESAVVGVPDDVLGEKVLAILVLRPDAAGTVSV